jgi:hypothetical protein
MSQRNRIVLATAALLAALFLASPSPSHAAVHPWQPPVVSAWERAWTWLLHLLPGGAPQKPGGQEKEGSAISPDGRTGPGLTSSVSPGTQPDEGSAINPNGAQ